MDAVTRVLATTNEISLKGGNRRWFERQLTANVRHALKDLPVIAVQRPAWRVLVSFAEPVPFVEVARRLGTVFGLQSIMPVGHGGATLDELTAALPAALAGISTASFAVRCTRSDKRFALTSVEIERAVGTVVQQLKGWRVDLGAPELVIRVLYDENGFWFWPRQARGPGGLPIGVGGRALCLLSGGIDSPVAAYLMMKRGVRLDFVHFHSLPRTSPVSVEKAEELVKVLNMYQREARLVTVPLLPIQEEVVARCPAKLRVLLYRRFMLRLAERCARRLGSSALVTGESLGQVSSQTIENLAAVEAVSSLPVLRPLIGLDKQEIIALARRAGTYEISIEPHQDCCSLLVPSHPATKSTDQELSRAEQALDVAALVDAAGERAQTAVVTEATDWEDIPVPVIETGAGLHRHRL